MIVIFYGNNTNLIEQQGQDSMLSSLSRCRRERVLATASPETAKQALASSWLLEQSLRQQGVREPFVYDTSSRGKPYLVNTQEGIQFSLSHTKDISAVVLAKEPVGVDVEHIGRGKEAVVNRFFSDGEQEYLGRCVGQEWERSFTLLWTLKEAVAKCLDVSLLQICKEVDLSHCATGTLEKTHEISVPAMGELFLRSYQVENHMLSCASVTEEDFSLKFIDKY